MLSRMRVLVVEDDAALASGLCELLEGAGHEVRLEEEGPAAAPTGSTGEAAEAEACDAPTSTANANSRKLAATITAALL